MNKRLIALILAVWLMLPAFEAFAADSGGEAPKVTAIRGSATVQKAGGVYSAAIYRGMEIGSGDIIATGANASVTVSYNKKEIIIGEHTRVALNAMWNRHERDISAITLIEGMVKNRVDVDLNKNSKNEIRTSNTVAGVRGTEYVLIYSRMSLEDGGGENPHTRLKVIDGAVRFDTVGEDEEQQSFLVDLYGAQLISNNIKGVQSAVTPDFLPDNLVVPLEALDTSILGDLKRNSRAREHLGNIDAAIQTRNELLAQQADLPERPNGLIYESEAAEVLPTLAPPPHEDNSVPPPSQASSSQTPPQTPSSSSPQSASHEASVNPSSSQSLSPSSAPPPSSSVASSSSQSSSSRSSSSSNPTPTPTPASAVLYIEDISGDAVTAILNKLATVTSTLTVTSRGQASQSLGRELVVPNGKTLIIDGFALNSQYPIRAGGKLINKAAIDCAAFINQNSGSLNESGGRITCASFTNEKGGALTNTGTVDTLVFRNEGEFTNSGALDMETGINAGAFYNNGSVASGEALATTPDGTIYQRGGTFKVYDGYVLIGTSIGGSYNDCGKIVYTGGSISSENKLVDCDDSAHGHLSGITQ